MMAFFLPKALENMESFDFLIAPLCLLLPSSLSHVFTTRSDALLLPFFAKFLCQNLQTGMQLAGTALWILFLLFLFLFLLHSFYDFPQACGNAALGRRVRMPIHQGSLSMILYLKKIHHKGRKKDPQEQGSPAYIADSGTFDMYKLKLVHNKVFITECCMNKYVWQS